MERGFVTCNSVNHRVSCGNNKGVVDCGECLVGYRCGGESGTLGSGRGFTLRSDGVRTLGIDEGGLPLSGGSCG